MTNSEWIEKLRAAAAMCQSRDDALDHKYWAAVAFDMLPKASGRITELEAQVAALQEIAAEQKAAHIAFVGFHRNMNEDETKNKAQDEARRQLAKEHPEAFR